MTVVYSSESVAGSPRLLALDLGSQSGYSYIDIPKVIPDGFKANRDNSGMWDLAKLARFSNTSMRFIELRRHVLDLNPDYIVFEAVNFPHKSSQAARIYYGLTATVELLCRDNNINWVGIPTGAIKKRATSKGRADKAAMISAANSFFNITPPLKDADDDIADAMWLCQIGIETYGNVITCKQDTKVEMDDGTSKKA